VRFISQDRKDIMDEKEKERLLLERAKDFFDNEYGEEISLRNEITEIVENTIGKCSASRDIIKNIITKLEYHYGKIE